MTPAAMEFKDLSTILERLGVPAERVPLPRAVDEKEYLRRAEEFGPPAEWVDGFIVEKPMGYYESRLAVVFTCLLEAFLEDNDLGITLGEAGMVRIERQVRMPDVAFYSWRHFPNRELPPGQILGATPDLAVEVLSPTNTRKEMDRKRREYFLAGVPVVWEVLPDARVVRVYSDPVTYHDVGEDGTLDGGPALPGFTLSVRRWFDRAWRRQAPGGG